MKRFYRLCTGGPYGDATSSYDIILPEGDAVTVEEFIEQILIDEPNEWGSVYNGMREVIADYKQGEVTFRDGYDSIKDKKISSAQAHGGWSRMDYYLNLESQSKPNLSYNFKQLSIFDF